METVLHGQILQVCSFVNKCMPINELGNLKAIEGLVILIGLMSVKCCFKIRYRSFYVLNLCTFYFDIDCAIIKILLSKS